MQLTTRRRAKSGAAAALAPVASSVARAGFIGVLGAFGAFSWMLRRRRAEEAAQKARPNAAGSDGDLADMPARRPVLRGERFGPFQLIERIGEGGMAEVYSAVAAGSSPSVARRPLVVKRLRAELCTNAVAVAHFLDEGEIVLALRHPNIVGVRDFGAVDGRHYIAGDYVPGRDAGRLTRRMVDLRQRPMSPAAICYLAQEVLCGLAYAHHRVDAEGRPLDLVHRDITPENVMITLDGEIKLLDFGIARPHAAAPDHETDGVKGNVDFMSPEQARGMHVDRRSDLFSLGLVMYFCAARAPLYRGRTIYDRLIAAANGPGPSDLDFVAALPHPLPEILARALAVDPRHRYQTAAEMRATLALHSEGGQAEFAEVMQRLFGDEIAAEHGRLLSGDGRVQSATQGSQQDSKQDLTEDPAGAQPGAVEAWFTAGRE